VAIDTAHPQLAECENPMELAATTLVFRRLVTPVILPYDATHKYAWGTGIVALFRSRCGIHSMRLLLLLLFHTYPYYRYDFFFYSRSKPRIFFKTRLYREDAVEAAIEAKIALDELLSGDGGKGGEQARKYF
jgi:hypothetical protein